MPAGGSVVQSKIYQMYFYRFLFLVALSTSTMSAVISDAAAAGEFQSNLTQIGVTESLQNQFNNGSGVVVGVIDGLARPFHSEFGSRYIN